MRRQIFSLLVDLCLIVIATVLAVAIRDNFDLNLDKLLLLWPYIGWTLSFSAIVMSAMGLPRAIWRFSSMSHYAHVVLAVFLSVLCSVMMGFLFNRLDNVSRALPVMQGVMMVCLLIGARVAFRLYHTAKRTKPRMLALTEPTSAEIVLLVGVNKIAELYLASVQEYAIDRIRVVGMLGQSERQIGRLMLSTPVLGQPEDVSFVLNELEVRGVPVNRIVVTMAFYRLSPEAQAALLEIERNSDIKLDLFGERMLLDETQHLSQAREAKSDEAYKGAAAFVIDADALKALSNQSYWLFKRVFGTCLSLVLLVILAPLFAVVALIAFIDVGWPVTFWQQRPGLGGVNFRLYKFRTMAAAYDAGGVRIPDARRLSSLGKFLRKTRLDELPQLLHVFMGRMSFVGPRPLLPIDQSPAHSARLLVRPGMTGWAQVKGGRDISATDKAALDVWSCIPQVAWRLR